MSAEIPVSASLIIELDATVVGCYVPYVPARGPSYSSGGEPAEGGYCEDVAIDRLRMSVRNGYDDSGKATWRAVDVLEGVDTSSPAVQRLLSNILDCVMDEAQEELRAEAADCAGPDPDDYEPEQD